MPLPSPDNGIVVCPSRYSVSQTLDRLENALRERGVKIFTRIDQKHEADSVGLELRSTELLIFGNPSAGTPLMAAFPPIALDLPLKVVAWQDDSGGTSVAYNSAEYLRSRYGLHPEQAQKLDVSALVDTARS